MLLKYIILSQEIDSNYNKPCVYYYIIFTENLWQYNPITEK